MTKESPYVSGIADGLRCVGMIQSSSLPTRNRLAFLTLDSVLEISLRVYLRHKKNITLDPVKHRHRDVLVKIAKANLAVDAGVWDQLKYCYEDIRCPLYHEASDMTVTDPMLDDFAETVCFLMHEMFDVDATVYIAEGRAASITEIVVSDKPYSLDPNKLTKIDAIVLSIGLQPTKESLSILTHLRSLGFTGSLTANAVSAYLSQGKYFYKDTTEQTWKLTQFVGKRRFLEITGG